MCSYTQDADNCRDLDCPHYLDVPELRKETCNHPAVQVRKYHRGGASFTEGMRLSGFAYPARRPAACPTLPVNVGKLRTVSRKTGMAVWR